MSKAIGLLDRRKLAPVGLILAAVLAFPSLAAAVPFGSRTLSKGMQGSDVRTLQRDLTIVGIKTFASSVFSEGTKIHVKYFQRRAHLTVDGVVGPHTARVLKRWVAKRRGQAKATDTGSGGTSMAPPPNTAPPEKAHLNSQGLAVPPADAPQVIRDVIAAANKISHTPYCYGGGHGSFTDSCYDCSGSVSYALHGGGLLSTTEDSTEFESYGRASYGNWITIYANSGHAYMKIAGLWFDTADQSSSNGHDRWSTTRVSPLSGFVVRHPRSW